MEKIFKPSLLIIVAALILGACTTPPYVEPRSGNTAEMVVRMRPALGTLFYLNTYENAESCSGEQSIVSDKNKIIVSKIKVAAEKLTTLRYVEMNNRASCSIRFSFFGKTDHVYVLDTVTTTGHCNVKLWDKTDMKTPLPVSMIYRDSGENTCPYFKQ
ncbi:hypothetical protein ACO0LM_15030 [Undibacterium sp. Di26W]|uniref:hypothetical protein n=1 Tax=Undibacterium sp. Di26W TaxID=3413035 RepID=UPI003BF173AD